jgi:Fe-S-cluster-containing hydrogenase component 2
MFGHTVRVDQAKCIGCGKCLAICPGEIASC